MPKLFLLSPANSAGLRAQMLLNPKADFEMAQRVRKGGATLGETFAFLSGLYFRGKLAYAKHFADPPAGAPGALVITSNRGLLDADIPATLDLLRGFGTVPIDAANVTYRTGLSRAARALNEKIDPATEIILLGSIASGKYVEILLETFASRLLFPSDFVGRGDMSRGGLMLRAVADERELPCIPVLGATRKGKRPARLEPN